MESAAQEATKKRLQQFSQFSHEVQQKMSGWIFEEQIQDNPFVQGLNNIIMMRNVANDIYTLSQMPDTQQRQRFIEEQGYLKHYAELVCTREVNFQWFCKTLEMSIEVMKDLADADLGNKPLVFVLLEKLKAIVMVYQYAVTFSKDDLFSYDKTHEKWNDMWKFTTHKVLAPPAKIKKEIRSLAKGIQTATALSQSNADKGLKSELAKTINMAFKGALYFLSSSSRQKKNTLFRSNLQIDKVKALWNLSESGVSKYLVKIIFPMISYMKKIYISPRAYPMVTEDGIVAWMKGETQKLALAPAPADQPVTKENMFLENDTKICLRVICDNKFERTEKFVKSNPDDYSIIIYHIHGGGFISLSSRTHQTYTRRWAKRCGMPVFSVDYRKAPECPYPIGLADCWQTYNWLLNESHKFYNIKENKKIIIAGDSAGGNLSCGVTNLCIENNVQVPHAILSFYPAVNLSVKTFTPSLLHCFTDPLLSFEFLLVCLRSYITNDYMSPQKDYYISPLFTPDSVLSKYPPVRIFIGDQDPLHDDAVRFALRLFRNSVPVKLVTYQNMIHAFLSLDVPMGLKPAEECVEDSIKCISEVAALK